MWRDLTIRKRIYILLSALISISVCGGLIIFWHSVQLQRLTSDIIEKNMKAFETAEALESALVHQKGFVTYFYMDSDPDWLRKLGEFRHIFYVRLNLSLGLAQNPIQQEAIELLAQRYEEYIVLQDRVIDHYKTGELAKGAELHKTVRQSFFGILVLCEQYRQAHAEQIHLAWQNSKRELTRLRMVVVTVIAIQTLLVIGLGLFFVRQILVPVNQLLRATSTGPPPDKQENLVTALSRNIDHLLQDADEAQLELEKSRENLLQSEKMATVGKLAAGMAHSIRNPFTSVKMRLFSLSRSLEMDSDQKEDFKVISQEIRHIDTIVQNFLEFSRPPRLAMQRTSPSSVVDNAVQLLRHRLKSYGVSIELLRRKALPEVYADPEQLKEVLVNLIINACEAMGNGGTIVIDEHVREFSARKQVAICLSDSGPGIPESLAEKVFQPFFTTKEEGTGLGLSIAMNILSEHGGTLSLDQTNPQAGGASFVITLPLEGALE